MKYLIKVGLDYGENCSTELGYIRSISYSYIKKASSGEVQYRDKYGDVDIKKMFHLSLRKQARVYDSEKKVNEDIQLLRNDFNGLHYVFIKIEISEEEAKQIRGKRIING